MIAPVTIIKKQNKFSDREVGITHPDLYSFIRLADNGDIHIMAADGLGIVISLAQNAILLVADSIKFLTKDDEGIKFNDLALNDKAVKYSEPALVYCKRDLGMYEGVMQFLPKIEESP